MLRLIDRLAGKWLDWRTGQAVKNDPVLQDMELHNLEMKNGGLHMSIITPAAAQICDVFSEMLKLNDARNFVSFDMLPRYDREMRPVTVTVQWKDGKSPARVRDDMILAIKDMCEYFENNCLNFQYEKMQSYIFNLKKAAGMLESK